jgi:hypothetical protein
MLLGEVLYNEQRSIAAYTGGIPLLSGPDRRLATTFLRYELDHAGRLLALIKRAGGPIPGHASSYELGQPRNAGEVLALLLKAQQRELSGYVQAIPKLSAGPLRSTVASILANDAEHVVALRSVLGMATVQSAFATGSE